MNISPVLMMPMIWGAASINAIMHFLKLENWEMVMKCMATHAALGLLKMVVKWLMGPKWSGLGVTLQLLTLFPLFKWYGPMTILALMQQKKFLKSILMIVTKGIFVPQKIMGLKIGIPRLNFVMINLMMESL